MSGKKGTAGLSGKEDTECQCTVHNLNAAKRLVYFKNVHCPDTSIYVISSCLDSATWKVCESDCAVAIGFHREEGSAVNAFCPDSSLSLDCSWKCLALTMDSITLRKCADAQYIVENR